MTDDDVKDLRATPRFLFNEALVGSFGSASVGIVDISEHGVQVEHAQPVRLGTRARLWFKRGEIAINVQGRVAWSHLSKTPNEKGKYLYRSGIKLDDAGPDYLAALQALADHNVIRRDEESLERKKKRLIEKEQAKTAKPTMKVIPHESDIPPDQLLLIQHARDRLKSNPEERAKYFHRAQFSIGQHGSVVATDSIRHREDVLAVWEYLDRTIDLSKIVKVFENLS